MGFSVLANLVVSTVLYRQARAHESPALEGDAAHLRTDALTSAGVLVGLLLVEITGVVAFDSITALVVAAAIVFAGIRIIRRSSGVLVDEALPDAEMDRIEAAIAAARTAEVAGYHKLRARRAGSRRYIDLHVQYRSGTSLERAHELAHAMRASIEAEMPRGRGPDPRRARDLPPRARRQAGPSGPASGPLGRGQQIHGGGEADGADRDRVAGVAADREEDRGDRADDDDGDPGGSGEGHGTVFSRRCRRSTRQAGSRSGRRRGARRSPSSPRCRRTCAARRSSTPAARCSPPPASRERWREDVAALLAVADRAGGEPVEQVHIATEQGEVFALRHGGLAAVAVTERFALASLMFFDMRSVLRDLAAGGDWRAGGDGGGG